MKGFTEIKGHKGFTLIELIIVIVILGVLAITAAPRFIDITRDAKIASLNGIATQLNSAIDLVQAKARLRGLRPLTENPNAGQSDLIVDFGFGSTEVHFSNLCPESEGELGDQFTALDFLDVGESSDIDSRTTNQYSLIGFDVPSSGTPTNQGCYILYDSFATPNCTVTIVDTDC